MIYVALALTFTAGVFVGTLCRARIIQKLVDLVAWIKEDD